MGSWRATARSALIASMALGVTAGACGARTGLSSESCVKLDAVAEQSSLVVFVMLDSSGSMGFATLEGETKAKAVRDALADFFADPASAGIGVAESFFPILRLDVPERCVEDANCGPEQGFCYTAERRVCLPSGSSSCETDDDCETAPDTCQNVGLCADDPEKYCLIGYDSYYCNDGVACVTPGSCLNHASCDVDEYSLPVVDVGLLPGARPALLLGLDTREPESATPSLPALSGALATAAHWQDAHPRDKAIVLFATDGLPTVCDPAIVTFGEETTEGVPKVREVAASGVDDGVQTFVVGVFSPDEEVLATDALGQIAEAGGTDAAFIVTTDDTVSARLVETFNEIRARAHACEYAIPWPAEGGVDPNTLVVTVSASVVVPRVASVDDCDPSVGGFYFDRDPEPGVLPHRVILCPGSCNASGAKPPDLVHMEGECRVIRP